MSQPEVSHPDARNAELRSRVADEYRWGFVTDIEQEVVPKGLSEAVIRLISAKKNEPDFMLEWRLQAYRHWLTLTEPTWSSVHYPAIDYQAIHYYAAPKTGSQPKDLSEVDPELLRTYEKLGIPLQEREALAGVAVDAVFDSVSVATTFKDKLRKSRHHFLFLLRSGARASRPGAPVPRLGGALYRQLFRHAQLGGVY